MQKDLVNTTFLRDVAISKEQYELLHTELGVKPILDVIRHKDSDFLAECMYVELSTRKRSDTLHRILQKYRKKHLDKINDQYIELCKHFGVFK